MAKRERPVVVSTRTTETDRALITAVARQEGVSVAEAIYRLLMPAVRGRVGEMVGQEAARDGAVVGAP